MRPALKIAMVEGSARQACATAGQVTVAHRVNHTAPMSARIMAIASRALVFASRDFWVLIALLKVAAMDMGLATTQVSVYVMGVGRTTIALCRSCARTRCVPEMEHVRMGIASATQASQVPLAWAPVTVVDADLTDFAILFRVCVSARRDGQACFVFPSSRTVPRTATAKASA